MNHTVVVSLISGMVALLGATFTSFLAYSLARMGRRVEDERRRNLSMIYMVDRAHREITGDIKLLRAELGDPSGRALLILDDMEASLSLLKNDT